MKDDSKAKKTEFARELYIRHFHEHYAELLSTTGNSPDKVKEALVKSYFDCATDFYTMIESNFSKEELDGLIK